MEPDLARVWPPVEVAPGALPVIGHAASLARDPLGFLAAIGSREGLVEVRLGTQRAVLACDPDLTRQVLVNARTFDKGGRLFEKIRQTAGDGLVSSPWPVHRRHRPLVQPAFQARRLARYAEVMHEEATACAGSWDSGHRIDVGTEMQRYTIRVLTRTLFSATTAMSFLNDIQRCVPILLRGGYRRAVNPFDLLERIPTPGNRRFNAAVKLTRQIADTMIGEYLSSGTDHGDLLSMMLAARDEATGEGMTPEQISDHVYTLLIAGTETTASLLSWTFYLLGRYPHTAQRLHEELASLPVGRPVELPALRALDYTRRVILETLRLYPATWLLTRSTTAEHDLGGHRLPPGTTVMFSPYLIHRRGDIFHDPDRFDPDRWLPERAAQTPRAAFIPFGGGSRKCIGDEFGIIEATIGLVTIARSWTLEAIDDRPVRPVPRIALAPGPLPMTVQARHAV